jgi:tetratricopeptide (TPR) repeat protein
MASAALRLGLFVFVEYAGRVGWQWRFAIIELDVFTRYLALMVAPAGQTIFHAIPATTSFSDPRAIVAIATAVLTVLLIVLSAWRRSLVGFGLTWFVFMLVPSAMLVLLDRGEPMAERRVYFASAGLFLAVGHAVGALHEVLSGTRPLARRAAAAAGVLVLVSLAGRTVVRNAVWSSPILLWAESAERAPGHWLPALVLGESLHDAGRHDEAIAAFRRALGTGPNVAAIHENLGLCLLETRRFADATATFTALTAVSPHSAAGPNGIAMVAFLRGDVEASRRGFLAALDVDPRSIEARRGLVLIEELPGGSPAEALRRCEEIHLLKPDAPGARECIARHSAAATP